MPKQSRPYTGSVQMRSQDGDGELDTSSHPIQEAIANGELVAQEKLVFSNEVSPSI